MRPTQQLHDLGQRLWLDNISRSLLRSGTLARYIRELNICGLTSNPTIFDQAIQRGDYDAAMRRKAGEGLSGETLFFGLAVEDLGAAADLFRPMHQSSDGLDGWVSLEVSPLLATNGAATLAAARQLHAQAGRANLFIKIPGTAAGLGAIEEALFAGVPVNVTLLFSAAQFRMVAAAYMRAIERRIDAGLDPRVASVASIFVSRWDNHASVRDRVSPQYRNRLGIAVAMRIYAAWCELIATPRWQRLASAGARPQRLLWASTGSKDPTAADTLYIDALAAADTVNTVPEKTLLAFADHGRVGPVLPADEGHAEVVLAEFAREGIDLDVLAATLQEEGLAAFVRSWHDLLARIDEKCRQPDLALLPDEPA